MSLGRRSLLLALAVLVVDQASKAWLVPHMVEAGRPIQVTGFFNLVMVWNRGVSFGMFGANDFGPWPFVGLSLAIVAGLAVWLRRAGTVWLAAAIGCVIGGAVGNVVDRVWRGAVADFFDFHLAGYHWPAFNIADMAIVGGVGIMLLDSLRRRPEPDNDESRGERGDDDDDTPPA